MSAWQVARQQWVAWIESGPKASARRPAGPLDELDAELQQRLLLRTFPTVEEDTQSRPGRPITDAFESMSTLVRTTVDDEDDEDDATRVRRDPIALEVELRAPSGGLEISLQPTEDDAPELVPVHGETVVMEAPLPREPASYHANEVEAVGDAGNDREPEPASDEQPAAEGTDDGLFIPALTRTVIAPLPIPVDDEPFDELPPAISGQTVIGPPPAPPPAPVEPAASTSTTSGVILTEPPDEVEAAKTLIRGEIPGRDESLEPMVPRKSKVVIDPGASGVIAAVYDDEDEPEEAVAADEVEPDELDADDLLEEATEPEPTPPPAPSRPPPAREPDAVVARPARPPIDIGRPPPPLSNASLEAALSALPAAPPLDEGWQVDAFGEHYGALVSPLRAAAAVGEVEFILHCTGLHPGAAVLDVGCGDGAHGVALAARGFSVTGLDASPAQLMRASQAAQAAGVAIQLVAGDMRQPPVDGQFGAIVCIGSTLGMYTDEDDRMALGHMRERLAPGGRVVLHVLNRDYIVARLPARSWWQGQGCLVLDEAQVFSPTSRVHVHRTVVFETGKQFEHNIGLRLYGLTELVQMCAQVGLRVLEYSGSRHTRGRFYGATSSEIWLVAQRVD